MLVLPVWRKITPLFRALMLFLDLGRMDYYVKRKCCYRVVYEVVHKSRVIFDGECEGDVDFLVWFDLSVVVEAPTECHVVDRRWKSWLVFSVLECLVAVA